MQKSLWLPIVFLICASVAFFLFGLSTQKQTVLEWGGYAGSDSEVRGYLYELSHKEHGNSAYISTDKEITSENSIIDSDWTVAQLSSEELWNPRVCAKMPLTITKDGDVFMYETERQAAGKFISKIIWFSKTESVVREAPVFLEKFVGRYIFKDESGLPYFISNEANQLNKNIIDVGEGIILHQNLSNLSSTETVTLERTETMGPLLKIYDSEKLQTSLFVVADGQLHPATDSLVASRKADDTYVSYDIGFDFEAKYRPDGPYETSVLFEGEEVLVFLPESKVYSYILGAYR